MQPPVFTQPNNRAYLVLVIGVCAVSLAAILIRLAQQEAVPSLLIAWGRLLIAAILLTPILWRRADYLAQIRHLTVRDLMLAGLAGLFLALHFVTWVTSLEYTTVLISVVLVTTTPIWVALLEVFFLGSRLSRPLVIGLALALLGGAVIGTAGHVEGTTDPDRALVGAILSVFGAVAVAVYLVIGRNLRAKLALTPYVWLVYSTAALLILPVIVFSGQSLTGYSPEGYLWVIGTALVPQLIGHTSLNYALAFLRATYVSLATQLEPVLSAVAAAIVFAEIPGPGQILGGAVIVLGVSLATFWKERISRRKEQVEAAV